MDYIVPGNCTDAEFRKMWSEFEWENKVLFLKSIIIISDKTPYIHIS